MPSSSVQAACLVLQEFQALLQSVGQTSLYLVARPGPFCFTLCADGSEDKHKVLLGAQVTCSCRCDGAPLGQDMLCVCWIKRAPAADTAQLPGLLLILLTGRLIDGKALCLLCLG